MSLYSMNSNVIVNSSNYVKEPVDKIIEKIETNPANKIILTGPRTSGKSIVLHSLEKENINTGRDAIYYLVEPTTSIHTFTEQEQMYDMELKLVLKIYSYIKKNYPQLYENTFHTSHQSLRMLNNQFEFYLNNPVEQKNLIPNFNIPERGTLIESIVFQMKQELGMDALTICLDHFDWEESNCMKFQKMLEFYFQFFDRVILTSDDESIYKNHSHKREKLQDRGYEIIDVDYGKKLSIAKEIVSADFRYYARKKQEQNSKLWNKQFIDLKRLIDPCVYNDLIRKCKGDFNLLFSTIREVYDYGELDDLELNDKIPKYYESALTKKKILENNSFEKKFYL